MRILILVAVVAAAFFLSLPCGRIRARYRKLSWQWFLFIHLPVPAIVVLRIYSGFGHEIFPLLFAACVAGQVLGGSRLPWPKAEEA